MALSMSAIERIEEEFGGIEKMSEALVYNESLGFSSLIQSMERAFEIVLEAGRVLAVCQGGDVPEKLPARIADFMGIAEAQQLIGEVIQAGSAREVEAEPSKKGGATAEGPAAAVRGFDSPQPKPD